MRVLRRGVMVRSRRGELAGMLRHACGGEVVSLHPPSPHGRRDITYRLVTRMSAEVDFGHSPTSCTPSDSRLELGRNGQLVEVGEWGRSVRPRTPQAQHALDIPSYQLSASPSRGTAPGTRYAPRAEAPQAVAGGAGVLSRRLSRRDVLGGGAQSG